MLHRGDSSAQSSPRPEAVWRRVEAIAEREPRVVGRTRFLGRRLRPAGVLVPFYRHDGRPHLLFTKRSQHLNKHRGEISFPGGGREADDSSLAATAVRETWEELGIEPDDVRLIGPFDDVWSMHGYHVTPFVAEVPPPPVPKVDSSEVAEVIEVDVLRLMDDRIHRQSSLRARRRRIGRPIAELFGRLIDLHYYDYDEHTIWGMTGIIVHRLLGWIRAA